MSNGPASRECGNRQLALRYVTHRTTLELGAIATALPELLAAAFDSWEAWAESLSNQTGLPDAEGCFRTSARPSLSGRGAGGEGTRNDPQTPPLAATSSPLIPNPSPKGEGGSEVEGRAPCDETRKPAPDPSTSLLPYPLGEGLGMMGDGVAAGGGVCGSFRVPSPPAPLPRELRDSHIGFEAEGME